MEIQIHMARGLINILWTTNVIAISMKNKIVVKLFMNALFFVFLSTSNLFSQVRSTNENFLFAKEYSKEIALYNSKSFLFRRVLGISTEVEKFEIIPLAASKYGELTTLLYKSESKGKEGLILGFYGNYKNEQGVYYQGYSFKNFEKNDASDFLLKIHNAIETNEKFLRSDSDNNNIYFLFDDIEILITYTFGPGYNIRLFWNGFDSTWEKFAFDQSKKRFEKNTK